MSVLDSIISGGLTTQTFLLSIALSLVLGVGVSLVYMYRSSYTKSFAITLTLLPAVVAMVIMMVNGSIGTGVAVAGAFSLVRFRSLPGGAREICSIFFAMALGLALGMGYVFAAIVFYFILAAAMLFLTVMKFGDTPKAERELKITIPETLDYEGVFDDLFEQYTTQAELVRVKTSNMGTLYELQYSLTMKGQSVSKEFLDELRCRNGNLTIVCGRKATGDTL